VRRELVKALRDAAQEIEKTSVLSKQEATDVVTEKVGELSERRRTTLVSGLESGDMSRRQFLTIVGMITGGAFVGSAGMRYVLPDNAFAGPTGRQAGGKVELDVSDGDSIDSAFSGLENNTEYIVPKGAYDWNGGGISANNVVIDGNCATLVPNSCGSLSLQGQEIQFGRFRFDVTASKNIIVRPSGGPFLIHNLAWDGPHGCSNYLFLPEVDGGVVCELKQCWFGSGVADTDHAGHSGMNNESALKGYKNLVGDWIIDGCYFFQNGTYISPSAEGPVSQMNGKQVFRNCYAQDTYGGSYRIGSPAKPSLVENCTTVVEDPSNIPKYDSSSSSPGSRNSRGVWGYHGRVEVRGCDISHPSFPAFATGKGASLDVQDTQYIGAVSGNVDIQGGGSNPRTDPPEGCVTSAEGAVCGDVEGGVAGSTSGTSGEEDPC
jgi:hypothetical protein